MPNNAVFERWRFLSRRVRLPEAVQLALRVHAMGLALYGAAACFLRDLLALTPVLVLLAFLGTDAWARRSSPVAGEAVA